MTRPGLRQRCRRIARRARAWVTAGNRPPVGSAAPGSEAGAGCGWAAGGSRTAAPHVSALGARVRAPGRGPAAPRAPSAAGPVRTGLDAGTWCHRTGPARGRQGPAPARRRPAPAARAPSLATVPILALLVGCDALPGEGPRTEAITQDPGAVTAAFTDPSPYALIDVTGAVATSISAAFDSVRRPARFLPDAAPPPVVIGVGDRLEISVVSTSESGFLDVLQSAISPISSTPLPIQEVGADGGVRVPPLDRVTAAGLTVAEFERRLTERLSAVLVEPQVIVRIALRASARVAVLGDVALPGSYPIDRAGERVLDVIATAGGQTRRAEDLTLRMDRGGRTARVPYDRFLATPAFNIRVRPGDVLTLEEPRRRYIMLGAVTGTGEYTFAEADFTLASAIGRAGGLIDRRADRRGLFLYRETPRGILDGLGIDLTTLPGARIPTIYRFDMADPRTIFALQRFRMEEGDIVYVSNALVEEIEKVVEAIGLGGPTPAEITSPNILDRTGPN